MGTLLQKIGVKTGKDSVNSFDLSCFHGTTARFYEPRITYFHEFVPGEKWNMDARCSVTCMPMIKPVMGDIKVHNRFFFVPYYSIFSKWNDFIAETPIGTNSETAVLNHPSVPYVFEFVLVNALIDSCVEDDETWDFINNGNKYQFSPTGRLIYSILLGLGYNIDLTITGTEGAKLSMLPLLSYLKVYLDWYDNTAFDTNKHFDYIFENEVIYDKALISRILSSVVTLYLEKDYFTSSTLYPVGTNNGTMQLPHIVKDVTVPNYGVYSSPTDLQSHGTPEIAVASASYTGTATKFSIDAVNALTDYVKRHQLAGIQPFNRVLAEYGVTLKDEELRRSTFIGDAVMDVDVNTVVSNGYADDTTLGERAGLGSGGRQQHFDYSNENFGAIICVTTVVPRVSYVDGMKRHCLRTERFDFFTPSVEHLGSEPVLTKEVFNNFVQPVPGGKFGDGAIFGYMPRYAAYKTALDTLSGDFMLHSRRTDLDPWVIRRDLLVNSNTFGNQYKSISRAFTIAKDYGVNDLFVDNESDQFIIFNMYHVRALLPMHKLFDDYQWSNENDNPKEVTIHNQGVQLT